MTPFSLCQLKRQITEKNIDQNEFSTPKKKEKTKFKRTKITKTLSDTQIIPETITKTIKAHT